MKKNHNLFIGGLFIIIGALFLFSNLGYLRFSWSYVWPLALLIPGIYLHISFFTGLDKNPGILVPGGILTTYGLLFYANVILGWGIMAELWPIFLIGISIGLTELYIFGSRDKALLIPIGILGGLGFIFLTNSIYVLNRRYIAPVFLIILGVLILIKGDRRNGVQHRQKPENTEIIVQEKKTE